MIIGGFQKFSLIDYPGKICAIVFTQGCNFRCPYCHNPELVNPELFLPPVPEGEIFSFLKKRKGKLDAVSITGGEPTLQAGLSEFLRRIKGMGYLTKLDVNGSNPGTIREGINLGLVDYFAMDVKAPLSRYKEITNSVIDPDKISESISLIMNSGVDYEFRTTMVKSQLDGDDIREIAKMIKGARLYILQKFVSSKTLNPEFLDKKSYDDCEIEDFINISKSCVARFIAR